MRVGTMARSWLGGQLMGRWAGAWHEFGGTGAAPAPGLLCSESCLLFPRALAHSPVDEGVELLGVRPPKRPPSLEPESFLLPPLSLVCLGLVGFPPSEPAGSNLLFYRWANQRGPGAG